MADKYLTDGIIREPLHLFLTVDRKHGFVDKVLSGNQPLCFQVVKKQLCGQRNFGAVGISKP